MARQKLQRNAELRNKDTNTKSEFYEKEQSITILTERDSLNTDSLSSLADQVMKLMKEIEGC